MSAFFRPDWKNARRLFAVTALAASIACDPPRRARPAELDAPPLPAGLIEVVDPPPSARPILPSPSPTPVVIEVTAQELLDEGLERVDLEAARASGALTVETNDPSFMPQIQSIFDGDTETLARGDGINPLQLTIELAAPVRLKLVRVVLAGSAYDWLVEAAPGEDQQRLDGVPERTWSQVRLDQPVATQTIRFEMRRLERDDFVHVNEVELWVESER